MMVVYAFGASEIYGGLERISSATNDFDKVLLGYRYEAARWSAGAEAVSFRETGSGSEEFYGFYADFQLTEAFKIGAEYVSLGGFGGDAIYGIQGEYGLGQGGFAELGMFDEPGDDDSVFSASIGFRF